MSCSEQIQICTCNDGIFANIFRCAFVMEETHTRSAAKPQPYCRGLISPVSLGCGLLDLDALSFLVTHCDGQSDRSPPPLLLARDNSTTATLGVDHLGMWQAQQQPGREIIVTAIHG